MHIPETPGNEFLILARFQDDNCRSCRFTGPNPLGLRGFPCTHPGGPDILGDACLRWQLIPRPQKGGLLARVRENRSAPLSVTGDGHIGGIMEEGGNRQRMLLRSLLDRWAQICSTARSDAIPTKMKADEMVVRQQTASSWWQERITSFPERVKRHRRWIGAFILLGIADVISTQVGLSLGVSEANPIQASLLESAPVVSVVLRLLVPIPFVIAACWNSTTIWGLKVITILCAEAIVSNFVAIAIPITTGSVSPGTFYMVLAGGFLSAVMILWITPYAKRTYQKLSKRALYHLPIWAFQHKAQGRHHYLQAPDSLWQSWQS